ncbi:hypothetical protein C5167_043778 [Papaver somniferum]|uniref:Uncharacterized protein n=1 Tax=Papaver somniferum TaxID=3469 RepID=A0A4Y7L6P0_PAPSO|nr:hypothetical protein C5167_043778 [Papaver somniferum]
MFPRPRVVRRSWSFEELILILHFEEKLTTATPSVYLGKKEPIVDIDGGDADNQLAAVEYVEDFYKYYKLAGVALFNFRLERKHGRATEKLRNRFAVEIEKRRRWTSIARTQVGFMKKAVEAGKSKSGNGISRQIISEDGFLLNLGELDLSSNKFSGQVPSSVRASAYLGTSISIEFAIMNLNSGVMENLIENATSVCEVAASLE